MIERAFDRGPIPLPRGRDNLLSLFLSRWLMRFAGRPVVLGHSCCLSFAACWLEWASPNFRRDALAGVGAACGADFGLGRDGLFRRVAAAPAAELLPPVDVDVWAGQMPVKELAAGELAMVGDVGWIRPQHLAKAGLARWEGCCGIFGGYNRVEGEDDGRGFWWVLKADDDASPFPAHCSWLDENRPARVFRPNALYSPSGDVGCGV